ncbi:helix-turn-helix transcriptional regulator [Deinococcus navajonensis]|uniref:Helix-turn-helix transcriptional regulator n=1 Tax=Deinococcus navajonensis TaxID=309884 RepID=A0ABV8XUK5_9DEIO
MEAEATERTNGHFDFKEGSLYPALHRMEQQGLLSAQYGELGRNGKLRQYYALTDKGRQTLSPNATPSMPLMEPNLDCLSLEKREHFRRPTVGTPGPLPAARQPGLPNELAQQIRDELEEHALRRDAQLEIQRYPPHEALARAVAQLGPPGTVTAGMNKGHNMPKLFSLGTLLSLTAGALIYAGAGGENTSTLTLPVLTQAPTRPSCVRGKVPRSPELKVVRTQGGVTCYTRGSQTAPGAFLSPTQLKQAVQAQGGTVIIQKVGWVNSTFPGGTSMRFGSFFTVKGERYYVASTVVSSLGRTSASCCTGALVWNWCPSFWPSDRPRPPGCPCT